VWTAPPPPGPPPPGGPPNNGDAFTKAEEMALGCEHRRLIDRHYWHRRRVV
jgi:hypothetical protein